MAENEATWYSLEETMARLSLSRAEIYRRVKDKALKAEKSERRLRFSAGEVERYAGVLDGERQALHQALARWLGFFGKRLAGKDGDERPEVGDKPVPEQVAELGERIVRDALQAGAQDMYLDPLHAGDRLLYGVVGRRQEVARFEGCLSAPLRTWFKGLATLPAPTPEKISEGLGRRTWADRTIQFRLAVVPTLLGEHLHLHFFADYEADSAEALGYTREQAAKLRDLLSGRPGLFLAAGASDPNDERHRLGLAHQLSAAGRLVVSLEHRVQYRSELLVQLDLSSGGGPGFAALWRAALDMDPEVLLLDEVRDREEARALLEGVYGGAVVVAQIRAGGALDALAQLLAFDVDRDGLARSLLGVVERVVLRRLCPHCRRPHTLEEDDPLLGAPAGAEIRTQAGCPVCGDGFLGHRLVYGLWPADDGLRAWIRDPETAAPAPAGAAWSLPQAVRQAVLAGEVALEDARIWLSPDRG